jgi:hypothetical protein
MHLRSSVASEYPVRYLGSYNKYGVYCASASGTQEISFFIAHPTVSEQRRVTTLQNSSVGIETIATSSWPSGDEEIERMGRKRDGSG